MLRFQFPRVTTHIVFLSLITAVIYLHTPTTRAQLDAGPVFSNIAVETAVPIPMYDKFELSFDLESVATNPYWPFDNSANIPQAVQSTGVSVELLLLPPGKTDWITAALSQPCFYFQPVIEIKEGDAQAIQPDGDTQWRCRFASDNPNSLGEWQYRLRATDASGTTYYPPEVDNPLTFAIVQSDEQGFVRIHCAYSDPYGNCLQTTNFFELSNGDPFVYPLVNIEEGSPFNGHTQPTTSTHYTSLSKIIENSAALSENGVHFVRWFPTEVAANFDVIPFGGDIRTSWGFVGNVNTSECATKEFVYEIKAGEYAQQPVTTDPGQSYMLTVEAKRTDQRGLTIKIAQWRSQNLDLQITFGQNDGTDWVTKELLVPADSLPDTQTLPVQVMLHADSGSGSSLLNKITLQKYDDATGKYGPNLLYRADPDTHTYVDQIGAARLDKLLALSEQQNIYHKLVLSDKWDSVLARFDAAGNIAARAPENFYDSGSLWYQKAYARYFVARWSYSPALHSLEYANEVGPRAQAAGESAAIDIAAYVHDISARYLLMSNSFYGGFPQSFWASPEMDYADQHWYACDSSTGACDGHTTSLWTDSAAYVKQCRDTFDGYALDKPIVRGEGGVWQGGVGEHPWYSEPDDAHKLVYYHKNLWAHVGSVGYSCDGEWYPRLFDNVGAADPASENEAIWPIYQRFDRFWSTYPQANPQYVTIGTDKVGENQIVVEGNPSGLVRAWGGQNKNDGQALIWIDNSEHTWQRVHDGQSVQPFAGAIVISGFVPAGHYIVEWWDTYGDDPQQQIIAREAVIITDGSLRLDLSWLPLSIRERDIAVKIYPGFIVDSTADGTDSSSGDGICDVTNCTLRAAITEANARAGQDFIAFDVGPSDGGPYEIRPLSSALPPITGPVIIDGYTQPGAMPNTNLTTEGLNAHIMIELNGDVLSGSNTGLEVRTNDTLIRGLAIHSFGHNGISLNLGVNNRIEGNYIGTEASGLVDKGNYFNGVAIVSGHFNKIGGTLPEMRNLISGNGGGVGITANNNLVQGNIIGLAADGEMCLGHVHTGISITYGGSNNVIGGQDEADRNVISCFGSHGLDLSGAYIYGNYVNADNNLVQGNYVGTDVSGMLARGNQGDGVRVGHVSNNRVIGNLIAFNRQKGVVVVDSFDIIVQDNQIANNGQGGVLIWDFGEESSNAVLTSQTQSETAVSIGNRVTQNAIADNVGIGIDLAKDDVTVNDVNDADDGPNHLQNYPVITEAVAGREQTAVQGTLISLPNTNFVIELFAGAVCDPSGFGEGESYLGSVIAHTNSRGRAGFTAAFDIRVPVGYVITATATDPDGNTSEFSACVEVVPNTGGYTFRDSNDHRGPVYEWVELSPLRGGSGTEITALDGLYDGYVWPLDLPFAFPFYGETYTQLAVGVNGVLFFGDSDFGYREVNGPIPGAYETPAFIAHFWDDLIIDDAAVYYQHLGSRVIIQMDLVDAQIDDAGEGTWQVILYRNGNILYQYREMNFEHTANGVVDSSDYGGSATVGIQGDEATGIQYSYNEPIITNGLAICFAPPGQRTDCLLSPTR